MLREFGNKTVSLLISMWFQMTLQISTMRESQFAPLPWKSRVAVVLKSPRWEFSCSPVIKTHFLHCHGQGFGPRLGYRISQATQQCQKKPRTSSCVAEIVYNNKIISGTLGWLILCQFGWAVVTRYLVKHDSVIWMRWTFKLGGLA